MNTNVIVGLLSVALVAQPPLGPRASDLVKGYKTLPCLARNVIVDPGLAMLCRGVDHDDVRRAEKTTGPHAYASINIYADLSATKALKQKTTTFPIGAVIIKEKRAFLISWDKAKSRPNGVTGMIKRAPGYDPKNGDWEYFIQENGGKRLEVGRISTCVGCHAKAPGPDHLFATWWKPNDNEKKTE